MKNNTYLCRRALVAPVETALRAVPGGMIALESPAKCPVSFTVPDGLYWFLEDVPQHALLLVLSSAPMTEGRKTTREDIAAGGNVGQRVGTTAPGPWAIPKISYEAFDGCGGACRIEGDASFLTYLLAAPYHFQFFVCGATE